MSPEKRSDLMSRIRGRNTKPELAIRRLLWKKGFRFRLHSKALPGKPDLVLPKWRAAVFVHGCFWHRHEGCSLFRLPKSRAEFWDKKLAGNRDRDRTAIHALIDAGWRVGVVWECALRLSSNETVDGLEAWLRSTRETTELLADPEGIRSRPLH